MRKQALMNIEEKRQDFLQEVNDNNPKQREHELTARLRSKKAIYRIMMKNTKV